MLPPVRRSRSHGRELETDDALRAHYPCKTPRSALQSRVHEGPTRVESLSDAERGLLRNSVREFLARRWPAGQAAERSDRPAGRQRLLWRDLAGQGLDLAGRRPRRGGPARNRAGFRGNLGTRLVPGAAARSRGRQPGAGSAAIEHLHAPCSKISTRARPRLPWRSGAFDGDAAGGPGARLRGGTLWGKVSFVEGAQAATHFLIVTGTPGGGDGGRQRRSGTAACKSPPASLYRRSPSFISKVHLLVLVNIPAETLADIALATRLGCAGRALGAARAGVRTGRGTRQDTKAIRPAYRPVPGRPAQAGQLPDQPGRGAA